MRARVKGPIHNKVKGATLGAALAALLVAEIQRRLHVHLLPEEVGAIGTLCTFAGGWISKPAGA
jgi:hypothetical protein